MDLQHKRTPGKQLIAAIVVLAMVVAAGSVVFGLLSRVL